MLLVAAKLHGIAAAYVAAGAADAASDAEEATVAAAGGFQGYSVLARCSATPNGEGRRRKGGGSMPLVHALHNSCHMRLLLL